MHRKNRCEPSTPSSTLKSAEELVVRWKSLTEFFRARCLIYRVVKGGGPRGGGSLIFPNVS